ncbi:MAG: aminotransferase class I/II-fold pyridoxal phosphate-dependent enzyme, partial [Oscillospiraceae bacterium]|nr:aminotransferase class I/II-fold pyridoxal phosphate-dependent enzyme [Oscillospiraceae bacterium]
MPLTISRRASGITPSATLAIDARAKALKAQGEHIIGFAAGEPDFSTPAYICRAAHEAIDLGMTRYTPASGTPDLKKAVCEKLLRDNGLAYAPEQIIISNGAKHS